MPWRHENVPRLPVFGWQALRGARQAAAPCLLDLPGLQYSTSGRASILLALEALGIGPGDGVLLPTYHCPTMVAPAVSLGAQPCFYPIDAAGQADLAWLDAQDLRGVRVMLAAHYFGLPQPMARLRAWCDSRGIALIEDCAHALFGSSDGRPVGAWGDIAIASLTKFLPVPEGGCLVINGRARPPALQPCATTTHLRAAVDILEVGAAQGRLSGLNGIVAGGLHGLRRLRGGDDPAAPSRDAILDAVMIGAPAAGAELTIDTSLAHRQPALPCRWAAVGLPRQRIVQQRQRNVALLTQLLDGQPGLRPLARSWPQNCAPYVFPLWVDRPDPGYIELLRMEMPVFRWDRLWPGTPVLPGDHGRLWSHHVLQIGCHQDIDEAQLRRLAGLVLRMCASPAAQADAPGGAHAGPARHPGPVACLPPASP